MRFHQYHWSLRDNRAHLRLYNVDKGSNSRFLFDVLINNPSRHTSFSSNSTGIVGGREEDPTSLSAPTQVGQCTFLECSDGVNYLHKAFPWLVKVVVISPRLELLCGGVIATSTVVLVPAHCVTGIPTETIRVLVGQKKTDSDSIHDVAYHVSLGKR